MFWIPARNGCLRPRATIKLLFGRKRTVSGYRYGSKCHCILCACISNGGLASGLLYIRLGSALPCHRRTIYSGGYFQSKGYPDFFIDNNKDEKNSIHNPIKMLEFLQAASETKNYQRGIQVFRDFQRDKPDWFKQWPAQRIAALILHMYLQTGSYDLLFATYDILQRNGFVHGEGIYVTLIKGCIAMQDIPRALVFLEELKINGIRNIRVYGHIIMALINNNNFGTAFRFFKEMQHYELYQKTRKQFRDQDMLSSLLTSAASGPKQYDNESDDDRRLRIDAVDNLLSYLHTRGITVSSKLNSAIIKAITTFSKDYSLAIANRDHFTNDSGGSNELSHGKISATDVEQFARSLILSKKRDTVMVEGERLFDFVLKYGPFSTIVDGANVMLARKGPANNKLTEINEKNIFDVLNSYKKFFQLNRSLLIIPSTMERRSMFTESQCFGRLKKEYRTKMFVSEELEDDVALLLATIYNDSYLRDEGLYPNTTLITNDSLKDHMSILGQDQFKFKLWLKLKQLHFTWDCSDGLVIDDSSLPIVNASGKWSLQLWNGDIMNISKQ